MDQFCARKFLNSGLVASCSQLQQRDFGNEAISWCHLQTKLRKIFFDEKIVQIVKKSAS